MLRIRPLLSACFLIVSILGATATLHADSLISPEQEKKIDELIAKMTLAEKAGQLNQYNASFDITGPPTTADRDRRKAIAEGGVGSMLNLNGAEATLVAQKLAVENSRLGIPMIFGYDTIHGYKTIFPVPLAETASWDLEAIEMSARIAAVESAAAGLHWTFAPMVDLSRDSRWSRIMEGAGEDPYLGSVVAAARVRGFQGDDLSRTDTLAACAKHFAGYGFAEGGRDYNTVDVSDHTLHNMILPPFKAALDAGVVTFMNGFNEIGGSPVTADVHLQRNILKGDWDFQGFMVSDWGSIGELIPHGVAANAKDAARLAITAGSDLDMESDAYRRFLPELVEQGIVSIDLIDDAVRRILRVKMALGLFDDPYKYSDVEREKEVTYTAEHLAAARDVARKSIVLLKNGAKDQPALLPLNKNAKVIAVIGPLAADKDTPLGSWRGKGETDSATSLLEGVQAAVGSDVEVRHAKGADLAVGARNFLNELTLNTDDRSGFPAAVEAAKGADVVIFAFGEDAFQSGEARSQVDVGLKGVQKELLEEVLKVNKNVVGVLMNGRPMTLTWETENLPSLVEAWHLGSQAGHAIADVLFGDYNPSGKLPVSFPRHVGQEPLYYNYKNTGRPGPSPMVFWSHYTDAPNTPLFPFGFGLSYTTFDISAPKLSADTLSPNGTVDVSVTVKNTGDRAGAEVIQLYVRDLVGSSTRPVKELKGFQKTHLEPGQSETVTFSLKPEDLAFYTAARKWETEPGDFKIFVGNSSDNLKSARLTYKVGG